MKFPAYILCLISGAITLSCTKAPDIREFLVPEIASLSSLPETHDAVLYSSLKTTPAGTPIVGFYFGKDRTQLVKVSTRLTGKTFNLKVSDLDAGTTYWFRSYISNGKNEISSELKSFTTGSELKVPEDPENSGDQTEQPGDQPGGSGGENEGPGDQTGGSDGQTGESGGQTEQPGDQPGGSGGENEGPDDQTGESEDQTGSDKPVEFTVEIVSTYAQYSSEILKLSAEVSGDIKLISECGFMVGMSPEKMSRIKGAIEDNAVTAYLMGLDEGIYYYKAVITDGTATKESETCQINISRN